jgi:hypothetical protein
MSTNYLNQPEISRELIEASMKRARIARSNALWDLLGQLFSRPEHKADEAEVHHAAKTGFRLG